MLDHDMQLSSQKSGWFAVKNASDITDLDLQAFVDNQTSLSVEDYACIRQAIGEDARLLRRFEELQTQKQMLQFWWEENKRDTLQ